MAPGAAVRDKRHESVALSGSKAVDMSTWEERFRKRQVREPLLELIEVRWRMKGPSRRVLECGIYRTDAGLEVRAGYGEDLLQSRIAVDIGSARDLAEVWRETVVAKGGFVDIEA
jgi:hypothetical protein